MPFIYLPSADAALFDFSNAVYDVDGTFTGLTNGTAYVAYELSDASDPFTPSVALTAPSFGGTPAISGASLTEGVPLTVSAGSPQGNPSPTVFQQWLRNGADISGATTNAYTPVLADVGTTLGCRITLTNSEGSVNTLATGGGVVQAAAASSFGGGFTFDPSGEADAPLRTFAGWNATPIGGSDKIRVNGGVIDTIATTTFSAIAISPTLAGPSQRVRWSVPLVENFNFVALHFLGQNNWLGARFQGTNFQVRNYVGGSFVATENYPLSAFGSPAPGSTQEFWLESDDTTWTVGMTGFGQFGTGSVDVALRGTTDQALVGFSNNSTTFATIIRFGDDAV